MLMCVKWVSTVLWLYKHYSVFPSTKPQQACTWLASEELCPSFP